MLDTKEKMLRAAESLFSEHGFTATSVRMITAEADVNLAAMHYHFGSKEKLIIELFAWRLDPLNRERLELLDQFEAEAGEEPPALERILEAFVGPPIRLSRDPVLEPKGGIADNVLIDVLSAVFELDACANLVASAGVLQKPAQGAADVVAASKVVT